MEFKPKQYLAIVGSMTFCFANFIACGAKMYSVDLEEDLPEEQISAAAKDPTSEEYGIHSLNGWKTLPIEFKFSQTLTESQKLGLEKGMRTWEIATGKKLFKLSGMDERDGDSFANLYESLDDKVNGHYLDQDWAKTGKPELVLATTIWDNQATDGKITTADIRFNTEYYIIGDSFNLTATAEKEVADMQSLATHELGHKLGLAHVSTEEDPYSIMNPSLYIGEGLANRKISKGDIKRIQKIYGCGGTACDIEATFAKIEALDTGLEDDEAPALASLSESADSEDGPEVMEISH